MRHAAPFLLLLAVATASAQSSTPLDPALLAHVKWRSIGPVNTGGRVDDFAVARASGKPDQTYVATASGGVFKSANGGTSWTPVFDGVDAMMSIGAVATAPSNPDVVWVGTGEANNRQSSSWGDGIYKSEDGAKSWKKMGLKETRHIGRIVIDPAVPGIVYVAAVGHLWGSNPERGVFKTTDGGQSWTKVLYVDENTGATDLVMDPTNSRTLYAAMYQRQRKAWGFNGGGPGSGIYRSTDAGATWTKLTKGLPAGDKGRIGLALFAGDENIVYATIEAGGTARGGGAGGGRGGAGGGRGGGRGGADAGVSDAGIYRSTDRGESWEKISSLNSRPMYYSQIRVDPKDKNRVYLLGSNRGFYVSDDGGRNFTERFSNVHSEDHALWIDPDDPNHLIVGGDGGVSISWDRALTWDFRRNIPIGQFYEIDVDNKVPYTVCGGLQDNGLWCVPSAVRNRNGIADRDAWNIGGGDGFYAKFLPGSEMYAFEESQDGNIARVNLMTLEHQAVRPMTNVHPSPPPGSGRGDAYRWNWDSPVIFSSVDPRVAYMGANLLFKSTDRGGSWAPISPDLTTRADRDTLKLMGSVVPANALSRHDGLTAFPSITSIGESPLDTRVLYTGSDDGQVQLSRDGGKSWTNITAHIPGLPAYTYVSTVLPSRFVAGRVYATFDGHYNDDYKPYVYVSEDFGQNWRAIAAGLPETSINRIREHPHDAKFLVLAHERGVHFSNDGGATWNSLATNMPTTPTDDAIIHPRDNALIVGTHGRGIWILDDVGPLQALTAEGVKADAVLAPLPVAREMTTYSPQAWYGHGEFFAPNPDFNASITWYLAAAATGPAQVEITDGSGAVVRTLHAPSARGLNHVAWDLRMAPPVAEEEAPAGGGGRGGAPIGPLVLPGKYHVTVKVPGVDHDLRGDLTVEGDPVATFSDDDRRNRQAALMSLYGLQKSLVAARTRARALAPPDSTVRGAGADSARAQVMRARAEIDREIANTNAVSRNIEAWSGLPTADQRQQVSDLLSDSRKAIAEVERLAALPK